MAGWHHWLNGRESERTPGVGDGQGGLACCNSWGRKESDTTEWLNWTEGIAVDISQLWPPLHTSESFCVYRVEWFSHASLIWRIGTVVVVVVVVAFIGLVLVKPMTFDFWNLWKTWWLSHSYSFTCSISTLYSIPPYFAFSLIRRECWTCISGNSVQPSFLSLSQEQLNQFSFSGIQLPCFFAFCPLDTVVERTWDFGIKKTWFEFWLLLQTVWPSTMYFIY